MRTSSLLLLLAPFAVAACGSSSSPASPIDSGPADSAPLTSDAGDDSAGEDSTDASSCNGDAACETLSWSASPVISRKRNHHAIVLAQTAAGPFLYTLGGYDGSSGVLPNVDRVPIQSDGSLGAWVADEALTVPVAGHIGEVVSNVIVVAGGTMASQAVTDSAYSAVIGSDGSLGAWTAAGSVGHPRMHAGSFVNGNTIYVMGGFQDPNVWDDAVMATVQPDGTVSAWTSAGMLPGPMSHFSVSFVDGYVYLAGGLAMSAFDNPPDLAAVWRASLATDGTLTGWTAMTPLSVANAVHGSFVHGGYLYVAGGVTGTATAVIEDRVWRAPIAADHTLGAWQDAPKLPVARAHVHKLPVFQGLVYSIAGAIDFSLDSTSEIDIGSFP